MRKLLITLMMTLALTVSAQNRNSRQQTRKPTQKEQLQNQKKKLTQQRQAAQQRQRELEQQVKKRMQDVEALGSNIDDSRLTLDSLRLAIDTLNSHISVLDSQLVVLKQELEERRQHYIKSARYMYRSRTARNQMMFVLSARSFNQMYRRMRFMNEYTTYQRAQGEAVKQKSEQVGQKVDELNKARSHMSGLLSKGEAEQQRLIARQAEQQRMVAELQRQQQTVKKLIVQQQQEEAALTRQIDKLIAEELEKARKAEEERQRRLAEQRRREQEQAAQAQANSSTNRRNTASNTSRRSTTNRRTTTNRRENSPATTQPTYTPADPDRKLTGNFASNKGRLPIPITGSYRIVRNYGPYTLAGVTLNSSAIHLQGESGAQARCVFDGEVSSIFNPGNGMVVMVRHGRYISVYSNLSSVNVSMGQKVTTNQTLGKVGANNTLIFRLQNWDKVLNPKAWLRK